MYKWCKILFERWIN